MGVFTVSSRRYSSGFTLIELLVVSAIGILMLTGVVLAYNRLFRRQTSFSSAQEVASILRQAQSRSRSGDKPAQNCTQLNGYRVVANANTSTYTLQVRCDGGIAESVSYQLKGNDVFRTAFAVTFPPLPGPVPEGAVTVSITELGSGGLPRYDFQVTAQGVVLEGQYVRE